MRQEKNPHHNSIAHEAIPGQTWSQSARAAFVSRVRIRTVALGAVMMLLALALLGRSTPAWLEARDQRIGAIVGPWRFDLVAWEIEAIGEKLFNAASRPAAAHPVADETALVKGYIADAQALGNLERQINELMAAEDATATTAIQALQQEVDALRQEQQQRRPMVESIIQQQVAAELAAAGFQVGRGPFPPVWFTFVEPPRKLVVSPRDRIATVYSRMLSDAMPLTQIEIDEAAIADATDLSAYITNIGGLGAYPTMVVDRASLSWIFETVAHEWTHNYLTLFPLGLRYNESGELITINETVAEIVGSEIGRRVVARYYPAFLPNEDTQTERPPTEVKDAPQPFNFHREMRETRLRVDGLLAAGFIDTAEYYMEARRQYFVAHGYSLRVLNQAYFAFHGSYGTSAASTSPLGPKLEALFQNSDSLSTFLRTVRWFTKAEDIDNALNSFTSAPKAP
ncbi:MAG: hypothetical protein R2856_36855 [Caldilineaceae bacterium]